MRIGGVDFKSVKLSAKQKCFAVDGGHTVSQINPLKIVAAPERPVSYGSHAVRNGDGGKRVAVVKAALPQGLDAVPQVD